MTRIALAVGAGICALIIFGATVWFLGDALMLWLQEKGYGAAAAAGLTGVAGLVLVGLTGLAAKMALSPHRRPVSPSTAHANGVVNGIAADLGALAAQQIISSTRAHPYGTVGAALAAGIAVGAVPELRKSVMGMFKH